MQYCELHFAEKEFTVFLHLSIVQGLRKEISRALTQGVKEQHGLLLGRGNECAAIVFSFAPQACGDPARDRDGFQEQFSSLQKENGRPEILGYYRIVSGEQPVPDEDDLRILREFLPESASVLFLVGASRGKSVGSIYTWKQKDRQELLAGKRRVRFLDPPAAEPAAEKAIPEQASGNPGIFGKHRFKQVLRSPVAWGLAVCMAAVPSWRMLSTRRYEPPSRQESLRQKSKPLALSAKTENGRLRVTWNAASPLLVPAVSAVLSAGSKHGKPVTQVLDRDQLITGSATLPLSPEYTQVRLMVFSEETSELAPQAVEATIPKPMPPMPAPSSLDSSEIQPMPPAKNQNKPAKSTSVLPPQPAAKLRGNHTERMTVGFTDEAWRDRLGTRQGSVAGPSGNRVPPRPIRLVQPERYYSFSPFTLDSVQINVRVKIGSSGKVMSAEPLSWGNALLNHLSGIAVKAARNSIFSPAQIGDRSVPSTALLSYRFLRKR